MVDKERVSTVKPEAQQKPKPDIKWNDGDMKAYQDIGLVPPSNVCRFELKFLNDVDLRKGPIERSVLRMIRLFAPDYSTPKHERKQYVCYEERWDGKDWRGKPLRVDHFEGVYTKRYLRPHFNDKGDLDYNELDPTRADLTYTIPWNKKTIDEIIANSANTNKYSIAFIIKFAPEDSVAFGYNPRMATRSNFSYEQFAEWEWADVYNYQVAPTGNYWDRKAKQYKQIGSQIPVQGSHIA
jgi:hypothetical protein